MYHTMYSRVMKDLSRLLDIVPKGCSRAIRRAKRALVKGVKEALSRPAVGAAGDNNLALGGGVH